ncbi:hypothetical protein BDV93DRAFT_509867 [Ceratobasidium sp. AG-I]|nr:hypothetical protein BDV93DRAFT_509867 [Ceratobasidium sp. AG-I]
MPVIRLEGYHAVIMQPRHDRHDRGLYCNIIPISTFRQLLGSKLNSFIQQSRKELLGRVNGPASRYRRSGGRRGSTPSYSRYCELLIMGVAGALGLSYSAEV